MSGSDAPASIAVIGCGLMGGSLAIALAQSTPIRIGVEMPGHPVDRTLLERGSLTEIASLDEACARAECVVIATPVDVVCDLMIQVADRVRPGTLICDVASVKRDVARVIENITRTDIDIVATHPMCGSHEHGAAAARDGLYEGATWVMTPVSQTTTRAVERMRMLIHAAGADAVECDAAAHDAIVASTSHLVRMVAGAVACQAAEQPRVDGLMLAGGGLRDAIRLARGNDSMWHSIIMSNGTNVAGALRSLASVLNQHAAIIELGDDDEVRTILRDGHSAAAACMADMAGPAGSP